MLLEQLESIAVVFWVDEASPGEYTAEPVSIRLEPDGHPCLIILTLMDGVTKMEEADGGPVVRRTGG